MRHVFENQDEARAKGAAARQRMLHRFSPEVTARRLHGEFRRIEDELFAASRGP